MKTLNTLTVIPHEISSTNTLGSQFLIVAKLVNSYVPYIANPNISALK